MKFRNEYHGLR